MLPRHVIETHKGIKNKKRNNLKFDGLKSSNEQAKERNAGSGRSRRKGGKSKGNSG